MYPSILSLFVIGLGLVLFLYVFICLISKKIINIKIKKAFFYSGMLTMMGPFGEVVINSFCQAVFGSTLWEYRVYPIHDGYTSKYSFFIWTIYGFYLYLLKEESGLFKRLKHTRTKALTMAVDAIFIEILFNIVSIYFLGTYIFYYFPNDLWHLTTLVVIPFYYLAGLVVFKTLSHCYRNPIYFGIMGYLISFTFLFLT